MKKPPGPASFWQTLLSAIGTHLPPPTPHPSPDDAGRESDAALLRALAEGNPRALDRVIDRYGPLVMSVVRRYHADPHAAEDAAQDTFLRLLQRHAQIERHLGAWLKAAARSVCVDQIRAAIRRRQREQDRAKTGPAADDPVADGRVRAALVEAVASIDAPLGDMLTSRYFRNVPLRVLAGKHGLSVPTVHRRLKSAVDQTTDVLRDMGVEAADEVGGPRRVLAAADTLHRQAAWPRTPDALPPTFPGWTRPMRVGVLVSRHAIQTPTCDGIRIQEDETAFMTRFVADPRIELVSIVDPGTADEPVVERVVRDYELYGGLVHGDDLAALQTLDVIVVGLCFSLPLKVLSTLRAAVDSGVGFFNDAWLGGNVLGGDHPDIMALSLQAKPPEPVCAAKAAGTPCGQIHSRGRIARVTVHTPHPAVPAWTAGKTFFCSPCGLMSEPIPEATVVASREAIVGSVASYPATPYLVAGPCGRGRALHLQAVWGHEQVPRWTEDHSFVTDALHWLAEPRRTVP